MRSQLVVSLVVALLAWCANAQDSSDNCACAVGSIGGLYCGYCLEVTSCKDNHGPCANNVYQCNTEGGCFGYGFSNNCSKAHDAVHCGPHGPSPISDDEPNTSHTKTKTPQSQTPTGDNSSPTGNGSSVPSRNNGQSQDSSGGGLSASAQAGVGVGVAVGVLLFAGLLAWFLIRRRRASKTAQQLPPAPPPPATDMKTDHLESAPPYSPVEMEKSPIAETVNSSGMGGTLVGTPVEGTSHHFKGDSNPVAELHPQHGRSELP